MYPGLNCHGTICCIGASATVKSFPGLPFLGCLVLFDALKVMCCLQTGTLSARSSARSTRDDDIPTRSMADILGNDSVRLQVRLAALSYFVVV